MSDCFFHTGRPSVARCRQCGRPLCQECRIVTSTGIYCSEKCEQTGAVFEERAQKLEEQRARRKSSAPKVVRTIIIVAILVILAIIVKRVM